MEKGRIAAAFLLTAALLTQLAGCALTRGNSAETSDEALHEPLTIFAPLCELDEFFDVVHEKYPEIRFDIIPYSGANTTAYMLEKYQCGDIPDIFAMTYNIPKYTDVSDRLLDLSGYGFTDNYKENCLSDVTTESGAIYALPSHYQCFGITYNKTLMETQGWQIPENLADLEELSAEAEKAGVRLALNQLQYPGYGFQYLCNICDTGFLSTMDGRRWQSDYLDGSANVSDTPEMLECLSMLEKWRDIGMLNGDGDTVSDKNQKEEFLKGDTLFMLGNSGLDNDSDSEFGLMPYISEDGRQNVYILSVRRYFGLGKSLGQPGNEQKLKDAIHVMEVLSTVEGMDALGGEVIMKSSLLPLRDAPISEDNYYAAIAEELSSGHTAPFIYSGWENAIVPVGEEVTSFITGQSGLDDVVRAIDDSQDEVVNNVVEAFTTVTEQISQEDCARLVGTAFARSTDSELALVSLNKWITGHTSTQNPEGVSGSLYPVEVTEQEICAITPTGWKGTISTVTLTGARISELQQIGYDRCGDGQTYPYLLVAPEGFTIDPDRTYKLVICGAADEVKEEGSIQDSGILGLESVKELMSEFDEFSAGKIVWK